MNKIGQYQTSAGSVSVFADDLSGKEIFSDGAFEVLDFGDRVKLRFFSNTGLSDGDAAIAEHTQTVVLPKSAVSDLAQMIRGLEGGEPKSAGGDEAAPSSLVSDKYELFREV